jgi:hypothetical protein
LAGIVAPVVTGFIIDRTGAFTWAFTVSAGAAALGMVAWGIVLQEVVPVQWPQALSKHASAAG